MDDRFQACDSRRLVALLELGSRAPSADPDSTGSSFIVESDARRLLRADAGSESDPDSGGDTVPQIDGYEITGRLGEGGMGVVWRAVQRSTRRAVALKVRPQFAPGASRARLRFEREIELAARLEHRHIARVYDSGVCRGLDYYGMELVEGVHLDRYVAASRLDTRQILALVRDVCLAVHYAHQRGVIHRDIKPSNILVTPDGQPHVVDFGLAKALAEESSSDPSLTQEGSCAGTPAFMSPEQAAGKLERIDTRTDVWGLGATLYLLLVGRTPHDTAGPRHEVLRRVAEEEVRRPRQLSPQLDPELESLLLKALAHEPEQRYGSAAELAQEIDHYLAGEPLRAAPPSKIYRLRKFARKHRWPLSGVASFLLLLLAATAVSLYQAQQIARERDQALAEKRRADEQAAIAEAVSQFQTQMLTSADPRRVMGDKVTVVEAITAAIKELDAGKLKHQPLVEARVRDAIGMTLQGLGRYADAEPNLRLALDLRRRALPKDHLQIADSARHLAIVLTEQWKLEETELLLREALEIQRTAAPAEWATMAVRLTDLATVLHGKQRYTEAEPLLREALAIHREQPESEQMASCLYNLAQALRSQGRIAETEAPLREALEVSRRVLPPQHPQVSGMLHAYGGWLLEQDRNAEAEPLLREALDLHRRYLPADHPDIATSMGLLAELLQYRGKFEEAESLLRGALDLRRRTLAPGHPKTCASINSLGVLLTFVPNRADEAESLLREALALRRTSLAADHPAIAQSLNDLARALFLRGDMSGAEAVLRESLQILRRRMPDGHPDLAITVSNLARALQAQGKLEEAEAVFHESVEMARKTYPPGHPEIGRNLYGLSRVLHMRGEANQAEAALREALEIFRHALPEDDPCRLGCITGLSTVLYERAAFEEALVLLEEVRPPSVEATFHRQPDLEISFCLAYGSCLAELKRWGEAEPPLRRAYELIKAYRLHRESPVRALLGNLAEMCDATGRPDEAAAWRAELSELQATTRPTTAPAHLPR